MITSTCMAKSVVTQPTLTSAEGPQLPASIWTCFMLLGVIQPPPPSSSSSSSASSSLFCSPSSSCWSPLVPSCSSDSAAQLSADRSTDSSLFVTVMASVAYRGKNGGKYLYLILSNMICGSGLDVVCFLTSISRRSASILGRGLLQN